MGSKRPSHTEWTGGEPDRESRGCGVKKKPCNTLLLPITPGWGWDLDPQFFCHDWPPNLSIPLSLLHFIDYCQQPRLLHWCQIEMFQNWQLFVADLDTRVSLLCLLLNICSVQSGHRWFKVGGGVGTELGPPCGPTPKEESTMIVL